MQVAARQAGRPDERLHVIRPRLFAWIPQADDAWATLISAPAGYGKTLCLRAMAERMSAEGRICVRLDIPASPEQGLEAALAGALARAHGDEDTSDLREALAAFGETPLALIVDDLDHWSDGAGLIPRLAAIRGPQTTLLAARRERQGAGLARLQVNGELREIGAAELRFTDEETAGFLSTAGLSLDPALRGEVQRITEGWPVALQLAAPLLGRNLHSRAALVQRLARPTGPLGAYLTDELIGRTPEERRSALLEAGALGSFTRELLEEAIGCQDGAMMIRRLDAAAFFVEADETDDRWRRFHPLVSAFLEATLRAEAPVRSREVHTRAAAWHERHGALSEAINHAFAGQDVETGVRLLDAASGVRERIGRWRALTGWTARLRDELLDDHPAIRIEAACAHAVLFEFEAARVQLEAVRASRTPLTPRAADELLAAEAVYVTFSDDPEGALRCGEEGQRKLQGADPYVVGSLRLASGVGWVGRGDLAKAHAELQAARATYENGRSYFGAAMSLALVGLTCAMEGRLERALAAWREGEALIRPLETAAAIESIAIGYAPLILYEQNRLDAVDTYLARCFSSTAEILLPDMVSALYVAAARTAFARGDHDRAADYLEEAEVAGLRRNWPRLTTVAGEERVTLALRREDWAEATRLKQALDARTAALPRGPRSLDLEGPGLLEWRLRALRRPDRALIGELRAAATRASSANQVWRTVKLHVLEAVARERTGDRSGALRVMTRAVELGTPGGFVRAFIDEGPLAVSLVRRLAEQEAQTPSPKPLDYGPLLAAAGAELPPSCDAEPPLETLSPREVDVLRMVAAGLSNRELATRLAVSENTVKWHLQRVFAKLGVKNRTRAIVVGRQHELID